MQSNSARTTLSRVFRMPSVSNGGLAVRNVNHIHPKDHTPASKSCALRDAI